MLLAAAIAVLGGCGADLTSSLQANSVAAYQQANAFSPIGYSIVAIDESRVRVVAVGTSSTPKDRIEKIAMARAAEYGEEQKKRYFQAGPARHSVRCGKTQRLEKGQKIAMQANDYPVAEVDVVYADTPADPTFRGTRETAQALKTELQTDVVPPEIRAEAAGFVASECRH